MDWIYWVFDGIGSQIVGLLIGLLVGGTGGVCLGYRIGIQNRIQQKQKGRDNANQIQIGSVNNVNGNESEKR